MLWPHDAILEAMHYNFVVYRPMIVLASYDAILEAIHYNIIVACRPVIVLYSYNAILEAIHYNIIVTCRPVMVLASYDAIKEAFLARGGDFASRPSNTIHGGGDYMEDGKPFC